MVRHLITSWHLNIWKVKIWLSQERKELSKWNKKHFSSFHKCSLLDVKNKLAKMYRTQPLNILEKHELTLYQHSCFKCRKWCSRVEDSFLFLIAFGSTSNTSWRQLLPSLATKHANQKPLKEFIWIWGAM